MSTTTQARPQLDLDQFKSVQDFWQYHTDHPEDFAHLDATGVIELSRQVRSQTDSEESPLPKVTFRPLKTASKNGNKWELNGKSTVNGEAAQKPGYANPPKESQFQPGHPGGPGRPPGPRSMRKFIRTVLFEDDAYFAAEVTKSLFKQALRGNTYAIRLIMENGNNRPKRR